MDKKHEAISQAYQALGMSVPEHADENGWIGISVLQLAHIQDEFIETFNTGKVMLGRPILLEGLEENNGWLPLPTKTFLPHGYYWVKVLHPTTGISDTTLYHLNEGIGIIPFAYGTHYMPIEKPKPPIY